VSTTTRVQPCPTTGDQSCCAGARMGIHTRHVCNGTVNTSGAGRLTRCQLASSATRFAPRTRPEMKPAHLPREWKASAERPKCNHAPWAEVRSVGAFASSCTSMTKRSGTYIEQISRCPEFCVRQARQQRLDMRRGDVAPLFTEVRGTGILRSLYPRFCIKSPA
jgi:hypothetical protein